MGNLCLEQKIKDIKKGETMEEIREVQTTCNYCSIGCDLTLRVKDNHIERVIPTKHYPVNQGFCCMKGLSLDKQNKEFKNPRLPMIRNKEGKLEQVTWPEAFEYFAKRVKEIQDQYGKESIAFLSTGQLTTEEMALLGHVGRNFLGMDGDGNTRLCMATSVVAHKQSYGFDAPPYTLNDLEISDLIIFIGANPVVAHPILWGRVRKNPNPYIVVIDPRKSETAQNANLWLNIKPKGDLYLLYTLANVLIEKGWIDEAFIEKSTEGFEDFKAFVKDYTLEKVEEMTHISKGQVLQLAELIHTHEKVSLWWTMGVNQSYQAVRTAQAIINIALMTGNIGKPGTGANSITGQCNAMGSRMFSNTTGFYGGGEYNDPVRRKRIAEVLDFPEDQLPTRPSITYDQIVEKMASGEIKGLWVNCTNPRASWINNDRFRVAAQKAEFIVVQDIYDDTDTEQYADLIMPSTSGLKKEGCLINTERRVGPIRPVLPKEENELTDYDIFLGVGEALGMGHYLDKWRTPRDAFEVIKECSKGMPCDITGITYDMLTDSKGIQWPFREGDTLEDDQRRLYEDGKFFTQSGKAKFIFEENRPDPVQTSPEYPFFLNTGRGTVGQWHTQTRTREIAYVEAVKVKEAYIQMNPDKGREMGLYLNDVVTLYSSNGHHADFRVKFSDRLNENELYAPMHYREANFLLPSVYDPYSKEPSFKSAAVRIEKKVIV